MGGPQKSTTHCRTALDSCATITNFCLCRNSKKKKKFFLRWLLLILSYLQLSKKMYDSKSQTHLKRPTAGPWGQNTMVKVSKPFCTTRATALGCKQGSSFTPVWLKFLFFFSFSLNNCNHLSGCQSLIPYFSTRSSFWLGSWLVALAKINLFMCVYIYIYMNSRFQ